MADEMNRGFSATAVLLQYSGSVGTFGQLAHIYSLTEKKRNNSSDSLLISILSKNLTRTTWWLEAAQLMPSVEELRTITILLLFSRHLLSWRFQRNEKMLPNTFLCLLFFKFLEQFEKPKIARFNSHSKGLLLEEYRIYLGVNSWSERLLVSSPWRLLLLYRTHRN